MASKNNDPLVILVVEDEPLLRLSLASHLADAGHEVLEAANGEQAIALIQDGHDIDVVVTDIRLGGVANGWDVGEASAKAQPGARVIYTTGYSIEPPRPIFGSLFFYKPYQLDSLRHAREAVRG